MTVYAITIGLLLFGGFLARTKELHRYEKQLVIISGVLLTFISGFRYKVGTDYIAYMRGYSGYIDSNLYWLSNPAVNVIARISKLIYNDYATWFLLMAMITTIPIMFIAIKYTENPELCFIFYVLLGCWHFSFNIVKQCAAATILLCGYKALLEKDFKRWSIICLIAATFHFSALLMIPVYFLVNRKTTAKSVFLCVAIGVLLFLFYDRLFEVVNFLKRGENTVGLYTNTRNGSVNILRVLVNFAPGALFLLYKNKCDTNDPKFYVPLNMSLLNMVLSVGAMNSIYLYRICVYTNIYNIILLPYLIKRIKIPERYMVVGFMIFLYTVFCLYDLHSGDALREFYWIFER